MKSEYETVDEQPGTSWKSLTLLVLAFNTPLLFIFFVSLFMLYGAGK